MVCHAAEAGQALASPVVPVWKQGESGGEAKSYRLASMWKPGEP